MSRRHLASFLVALFSLAVACATEGGSARAPAPAPQPSGQYGPKKTIAVARFDANGAFLARYGGYDVGGGLAAQLASALAASGSFIVVERSSLGDVLREQELALEGLSTRQSSPRVGQLLGAQLLVRGSVTSFEESDAGDGVRIGGPISGGFGGALATQRRRGHVAIDIRVIDTTTGRVVASRTVEERLSATSYSVSGVSSSGASIGRNSFEKTALGKATRAAIEQAVVLIARSVADLPWSAQVAKVKSGQVYVNAGANANLRVGDTLGIYRVSDRILDPTTREVLGVEERRIGSVVLQNVSARYAQGAFRGGATAGDVIRYERLPREASAAAALAQR